MSAVTVTTTVLTEPTDDAGLRFVPYQSRTGLGVVLLAGSTQLIFLGQSGKARAIATLHLLADELEGWS